MQRSIKWHDYLTINIYWFALTIRSQVLAPIVIPLLVQQFVGDEEKGTYVGNIRLWALMAALLVQALMGMLSDRCTSRWGRRRPFIVAGTLGQVIVVILIGFSANLEGMIGYWAIFSLYILSMFASDTAHGATQGLIPDMVPDEQRGRFSGVKALFELPIPLIFVSFIIAKLVGAGNLWGALYTLIGVLIFCMVIALLVREESLREVPFAMDWKPFFRLVMMTAFFTAVILGMGAIVKIVLRFSAGQERTYAAVFAWTAGLLGMVAAIGVGVLGSIRISIGEEARKRSSYAWWVVTRLAYMVASTNIASFIIFFFQERFPAFKMEKAAEPAARVIMLVGLFIIVTAVPSGWLADRYGKRMLIWISCALAMAGSCIVLVVPQMIAMYIGGCIIGASVGLFYSACWALGTEIVPKGEAGRYLGLSNLAGAGAGAIGAYIGGPIADEMGYVFLYSIYGALFLLAMFTLAGVKEPRSKVAPE